MAAVTELIKRLQLVQHLRAGFGTRDAPVQFDNVAEFARERTATGELNADVKIVLDLQEVEPRNWTLRYINLELFGLEDTVRCAGFPGGNEFVDDALSFTE